MVRRTLIRTYKGARRAAVAILGGTVLLLGVAMIVLPGPALLVLLLGLGILGLEFAWARRWLSDAKEQSLSPTAAQAANGWGVFVTLRSKMVRTDEARGEPDDSKLAKSCRPTSPVAARCMAATSSSLCTCQA